jgi:hypothetical protein
MATFSLMFFRTIRNVRQKYDLLRRRLLLSWDTRRCCPDFGALAIGGKRWKLKDAYVHGLFAERGNETGLKSIFIAKLFVNVNF